MLLIGGKVKQVKVFFIDKMLKGKIQEIHNNILNYWFFLENSFRKPQAPQHIYMYC